jgi:hypothetical protein
MKLLPSDNAFCTSLDSVNEEIMATNAWTQMTDNDKNVMRNFVNRLKSNQQTVTEGAGEKFE